MYVVVVDCVLGLRGFVAFGSLMFIGFSLGFDCVMVVAMFIYGVLPIVFVV